MAKIPFTLRIESEERVALEHLSKVEGRPINQLVNEAIKLFLRRRGGKELSMQATLAGLNAYRKKDPGFQRAIDAFVAAEATYDDPLEGDLFEEPLAEGEPNPAGGVQGKLRELLDG
jgi:hypothetical protein